MSATAAAARTTVPAFTASIRQGMVAARAGDRRATLKIAVQQVLFGLVPIVILLTLLQAVLGQPHRDLAVDFSQAYWTAGHRLLHGGDPYAWSAGQIRAGAAFVYPALSALVFVPFGLMSRTQGAVLATLMCVAALPLTLWTLNVRDWRIYGVTLMWLPFFACWQSGNETIFLVLAVALVWRYRDRPLAAGALTAVAISLKPFIWPLALWLLATRRWRAAAQMLAWGVVLNLVSWSFVGFGEIRAYLHATALDARYTWHAGYSVTGVAAHLGLGHGAAEAIAVLASLALAGAIIHAAFIEGRERQALTLTIVLMLVASPLVWSHYFALLLIPMAIRRPRFSWLWLLPILMWPCPPSVRAHLWQEVIAWSVAATMLTVLVRSDRVPGRRALRARLQIRHL